MLSVRIRAYIGEDRRLVIDLPKDVPTGDVTVIIQTETPPTAHELLNLTLVERDEVLEAQTELAEDLYRHDPVLTETSETLDLYDYPES